jgi:excisionase family DNA binding protein
MSDSEWVSLQRAAEILGVHPATVRNWADKGDLPSMRTPGGHRRFRKADLLQYAQTHADVQPVEVQVILQSALGQTRMHVEDGALANLPWYAGFSEAKRVEMRRQGRRVLEALRTYLAHGAPDGELSSARTIGSDYAALLHGEGLNLSNAAQGFFYFGDFVMNSILTWSEITPPRSPPEWANLLRQVSGFMNAMLLTIIEYYEKA